MILELSTDNILVIVGGIGAAVSTLLGFWMRSVSHQNKELKEELDELRDGLTDTRMNYVTNEKFEKVTDKIMGKLDAITELLSTKPDKGFCDIMHNRATKMEK